MSCSLREKILQFDSLVPRYTSYPTAPHFQALEDEALYPDWLRSLPSKSELSLYIHVPFCPKLCWYCGCNTKATRQYSPVEDYLHLVLQEIDLLSAKLGDGHVVKHVHFGGGSPTILSPSDFKKIMKKVKSCFYIHPDAEIAIEIDPRGLTEGKAATYAKEGVNRVSLGVQDFDGRVLSAINRPQPFHLSHDACILLRQYGINRINFDLLYGLPHQTLQTMKETIEKVIFLSPDRIALFGYAHVPWMKKHMRLIDDNALPDSSARFDLFEVGAENLEAAGYEPLGIDHFAKPEDELVHAASVGQLKRNFQGYTSDKSKILIGIGASSIGQLRQGYIQNARDIPSYKRSILAGKLPAQNFYTLSDDDCLRSSIIERLMCDFKANIPELCYEHNFPEHYLDHEVGLLGQYEEQGFLKIGQNGSISINPAAKSMARTVCSVFDAYIDPENKQPKHSKAI